MTLNKLLRDSVFFTLENKTLRFVWIFRNGEFKMSYKPSATAICLFWNSLSGIIARWLTCLSWSQFAESQVRLQEVLIKLGLVVHIYNPWIGKAEAGGLKVQGQPEFLAGLKKKKKSVACQA
jgi:hypothetical protein